MKTDLFALLAAGPIAAALVFFLDPGIRHSAPPKSAPVVVETPVIAVETPIVVAPPVDPHPTPGPVLRDTLPAVEPPITTSPLAVVHKPRKSLKKSTSRTAASQECDALRKANQLYTAEELETWARMEGYSETEIAAGAACLK